MKVIYNLQDSITVLADGKVRLQPKGTSGHRATITDEQSNHPQVVAFSVQRRVNVMSLEESAAYEAQLAAAKIPPVVSEVAPAVVEPVSPPAAPSVPAELPAVPPAPVAETPPAPPVVETPVETPAAAPAEVPPEEAGETAAEGEIADTTEKDSTGNFRKRRRR